MPTVQNVQALRKQLSLPAVRYSEVKINACTEILALVLFATDFESLALLVYSAASNISANMQTMQFKANQS